MRWLFGPLRSTKGGCHVHFLVAGREARNTAFASSISSVSPINQVLGAKEDMEDKEMPGLEGSSDTEEDVAMRRRWLLQEEKEVDEHEKEEGEGFRLS